MALSPSEIIELLDDDDQLGPIDGFPWTEYHPEDGNFDIFEIDWKTIFSDEFDRWLDDPELDHQIREAVGQQQTSRTSESRTPSSFTPDVCAWYQPIHFFGLGFGIYITDQCVRETAIGIARYVPRSESNYPQLSASLVRFALSVVYLHEAYHHKTESLALRLRIVEQMPRYRPYFSNVYMPAQRSGSQGPLEEALANADSYRRVSEPAYRRGSPLWMVDSVREYLLASFQSAPPGYRDALAHISNSDFEAGENLHKSMVQEGRAGTTRQNAEWRIAPGVTRGLFNLKSGIWQVVPRGSRPVLPVLPLYRPVSTRNLERALRRKFGYQRVKGGKGSHIKLKAPNRPRLILPGNQKDLSPPVLRNIAKDLGFTDGGSMLSHLDI